VLDYFLLGKLPKAPKQAAPVVPVETDAESD
jgi:hypothetical protein